MSNIHNDLLSQVREVASALTLPTVSSIQLPHAYSPSDNKYAKFGLLTLNDDSAGFFYRLLDLEQWAEHESSGHINRLVKDITGENPAIVAELMVETDLLSRGLGMAATNAISQYMFRRAGLELSINDTADVPEYSASTHIGMVGYFGPTIARLRENNIRLTVLELDSSLYRSSDSFVVTGDIAELKPCDHIICTASTLLNDTLDELLSRIGTDPYFELVGPTCGCFADPLFARGVNRLGGSTVVNAEDAASRIASLQSWGESVSKYALTPATYPGFTSLLQTVRDKG